ncbi:TetR/AcrR family transcriptional regulator [Clostridium felsineum]|uniref:Nucleoid occlusion factor SlmA n=1 Tax=Clostridium felsineum TaxID=36839 RepID=A0A1S8L710_9CLOT|nr:TetR/AcrR family transcriptional regulator [Clostridium felsineum]MCR3759110.1 TetR/AcrR family transcriptional regulator [Clostridium felsineum]URZ07172.1 Nucleoid occlusion factor SlmA [Clostridium felsineum]URZ12201.1 Nucleoid occlusion factor SlmA [Clostridium felsineum]
MSKISSIIYNHRHVHELRKEKQGSYKKRISKEPDERKQEIIQAALELFSQKGYANTTIQDIAQKLHISQGLCYRYFKSKSEIFSAASEYYAIQAVEQIKIPLGEDVSAIDKFNMLLKTIVAYVTKNYEFEASFNENSENTEIRASRLDDVADQLVEVLIPIVEQGVKEQTFNCTDIPNSVSFFTYGLIHTFHTDVPTKNTTEYMIYFLSFLKDIFISIFKVEHPEMVGQGWME